MKIVRAFAAFAVVAAAGALAVGQATGGNAKGVDVSYYQDTIDWARVAASGVSFAFIRASDGAYYNDPQFARNWSEAKKHGIVRGVYQFFRPAQDATAQANGLLAKFTLEPGDLPPVCDVEVSDGVSDATLAAQVKIWCDVVRQKTGVTPIIYTSPGFWNDLASRPPLAGIPVWVANWNVAAPRVPTGWSEWSFWQYSETGTVAGITGKVDLDSFHGSVADLKAFAASHGVPGAGTVVAGSTAATPKPILREGSAGADVITLQKLLLKWGYDPGSTSGSFDSKTKAAVVGFQGARQLVPDGIVGPLTWAELQK